MESGQEPHQEEEKEVEHRDEGDAGSSYQEAVPGQQGEAIEGGSVSIGGGVSEERPAGTEEPPEEGEPQEETE
jgi:hypothetical protein